MCRRTPALAANNTIQPSMLPYKLGQIDDHLRERQQSLAPNRPNKDSELQE